MSPFPRATAAGGAAGRAAGRCQSGQNGVDGPANQWAGEQAGGAEQCHAHHAGQLSEGAFTCSSHRAHNTCIRCLATANYHLGARAAPAKAALCAGRTCTFHDDQILIIQLQDVVKHSRAESLAGAGHGGDASGLFGCHCWPQGRVLLPGLGNKCRDLLQPGILLGEQQAHLCGRNGRATAAAPGLEDGAPTGRQSRALDPAEATALRGCAAGACQLGGMEFRCVRGEGSSEPAEGGGSPSGGAGCSLVGAAAIRGGRR